VLTGLNHLTLAVTDLARSVAFYRDLLGLRLAALWDEGAYLTAGEMWLCLSRDPLLAAKPRPDYTHYAFSVSQMDFSPLAERLRQHGAKEWKENKSEGDSLYFLDPDGHKLEAHGGNLTTRLAECRRRPYKGMQFY
jgi:glutathione S-transferase fosA